MIATNELRFVEREVNQQISKVPDQWEKRTIRILQQKWRDDNLTRQDNGSFEFGYEWRDVEVVKEDAK